MTCNECIYFNPTNKRCSKYKSFTEPNITVDCNGYEKKTNKGIQKRNQKRKKNNQKMKTVKENQESICRFVWVEYLTFHVVNGKTKPYKTVGNIGLQIANKVYMNDGKYKFINNKNLKIKKVYPSVPYELVNEELIEKYKQNKHK
jgi:hypothetical protein